MVRHFRKPLPADPHIAQRCGHAQAREECACPSDCLFRDNHVRGIPIYPPYMSAIADKAGERITAEDIAHPCGNNDGKPFAVYDVIITAQGMFDGMTGPSAGGIPDGQDPVAGSTALPSFASNVTV